MEKFKSYFTTEGWKRDLEKTRIDFNNSKKSLSKIVDCEEGSIETATMFSCLGGALASIGAYNQNFYFLGAGVLSCAVGVVDAIKTYRAKKR